MGGIHKAERPSKSRPAKQCGFTPAKPSRMFSIRRRVRLARNLLRQRDRQCGSKAAATVAADRAKLRQMPWPADIRRAADRSRHLVGRLQLSAAESGPLVLWQE